MWLFIPCFPQKVETIHALIIQQITHHEAAVLQDMGGKHGSAQVLMSEKFLYGAGVGAGLSQARGKSMAKRVRTRIWL